MIVIEDGSIVSGSNSFITEAELTAYLGDRAYSLTGTAEPSIIRSYDLMLTLPWSFDSSVEFEVKPAMKKAQCEIAYQIDKGFNPSARLGRTVKSEKVDVITLEYANASSGVTTSPLSALKQIPAAYGLLKPLLVTGEYLLKA